MGTTTGPSEAGGSTTSDRSAPRRNESRIARRLRPLAILEWCLRAWASRRSMARPSDSSNSAPSAFAVRVPMRACTTISTRCRCFSRVRITCASGSSCRTRSSFASFLSANVLRPCVRSALRPVNRIVMHHPVSGGWPGSMKALAPLIGRRDAQLLAVLGHGAPRDAQPVVAQYLNDRGVGERPPRVLLAHDPLDALLDGQRGDVLALRRADARVEEKPHLVQAAWRVHVFVVDHAADGGLVHADVVRHVLEDEGPQVLVAGIQETLLVLYDAPGDLVDGALALFQTLDQAEGG